MASQYPPPPTTPATGSAATTAPTANASSNKKEKWEKMKKQSNIWFQKIGAPVNKLSNKLGAEAFWPTSLDKEADKAARILRSFCIDGFTTEPPKHGADKKHRSLDHIPPEVIRNCHGLAIFTVMRMGLHWSGAGGSGVLIAHDPTTGRWSAPSGLLIHTLGWGLVAGADIYDCVAVLNTPEALAGFTRVRATIGGEISAAVGPLGGGSQVESNVLKKPAAVWTYTKSKGLYVGVQVDGTVVVERTSENEAFYHRAGVRHQEILSGQVTPPPGSCVQLWETLQAAEGNNYDPTRLPPPSEKSPGDHEVEPPREASAREYEEVIAAPAVERQDVK